MTANGADEDDWLLRYLNSVSHDMLVLLDSNGCIVRSPSAHDMHEHEHCQPTIGMTSSAGSSRQSQQEPTNVDGARERSSTSIESDAPKPTCKRRRRPRQTPREIIINFERKCAHQVQRSDSKSRLVKTTLSYGRRSRGHKSLVTAQVDQPPSSQQHHLSTSNCNKSIVSTKQQLNNQRPQQQRPNERSEHQLSQVITSGDLPQLGEDNHCRQLAVANYLCQSPSTDCHQRGLHNRSENDAYHSLASIYDDLVWVQPRDAQLQFNLRPSRWSQEDDNFGHQHLGPAPQPAASSMPALTMQPIMTAARECLQGLPPTAYNHLQQQQQQQQQDQRQLGVGIEQPGGGPNLDHNHSHEYCFSPLLCDHESTTAQTNADERAQQCTAGFEQAQVYQQQQSLYNHNENNLFYHTNRSGNYHHHLREHHVLLQSVGNRVALSPLFGERESYYNLDLGEQQHLMDLNQHHHTNQDHHAHNQSLQSIYSEHHGGQPNSGLVSEIEPSSSIPLDINQLATASWLSPDDLFGI